MSNSFSVFQNRIMKSCELTSWNHFWFQ